MCASPTVACRALITPHSYYDSDANLALLQDKTIVFVGCVQALRRRDTRLTERLVVASATKVQRRRRTSETLASRTTRSSSPTRRTTTRRMPSRSSSTSSTTSRRRQRMLMVCVPCRAHEHVLTRPSPLRCTVVFLLIPDQVQPRVFNELIAPTLKSTAAVVVASGYNVFYKLLNVPASNDVVMVAPR